MTEAKGRSEHPPVVLHTRPALEMDEDQFFEFCQINRDWRIERSAEGDLEVMPPTGWETGNRNIEIAAQLQMWARQDGTGLATDSSSGFRLPNGAVRAPDAARVRRERLTDLTDEQKQKFLPLCPDFVIELRSPSDSLDTLEGKMHEYLENGTKLGWLIDAANRQVYIYRPGAEVERVDKASELSGDPVLSGFVLDLRRIWEPGF